MTLSMPPEKHAVAIVTACMTANGTPAFALNTVAVTQEEEENGEHYCLAEANLGEAGYEEPFVHFDQREAPTFLHPAVRQHLGLLLETNEPITPIIVEDRQ
jgi:hypothetical protein